MLIRVKIITHIYITILKLASTQEIKTTCLRGFRHFKIGYKKDIIDKIDKKDKIDIKKNIQFLKLKYKQENNILLFSKPLYLNGK